MNSLSSPSRLAAFGPSLRPGVPFSTRLMFGAKSKRPLPVMGNRAYIRAWAARQATAGVPAARAK